MNLMSYLEQKVHLLKSYLIFVFIEKERALDNYLFFTYFTKQGKHSLIGKLPCCYKLELMNYF